MSDTSTTAVLEAPVSTNGTPKPKTAKKVVKKPAAATKYSTKKPVKTATKKPASKKTAADGSLRGVAKPAGWEPETKMRAFDPKDPLTLRKPQARILAVLAKAKGPYSRKMLAGKSGVEYAWLCNWVGQPDAEARKDRENRWGFTSLLTAKLVSVKSIPVDDKPTWVYEITATGRTALAKYETALKEKAKAAK